MKEEGIKKDELTLYSRRDVCNMLKIGISHLDKIPENELPKVHLGKSIRYKQKSIQDYINSKEKKNG
jgi:predicted DNA-binding transcriptional regulator AlpA